MSMHTDSSHQSLKLNLQQNTTVIFNGFLGQNNPELFSL